MPGGVAIFDYNGDGRPDIFFTNGADIATLKKNDRKFSNRLFRNDGNGVFTDVTQESGLGGGGFDIGVAVADYDNDGHPDIFVAGVHGNHLFHNNGNGTFTDVTQRAGLGRADDPDYGPLWSVGAVWIDVNNDGLLDLFVVNYVQWAYSATPKCGEPGNAFYCHPRNFKGQPNQLFLNQGDGTFKDVSATWGIRAHVGKGMAAMMADYDQDGLPDIFVTNDASYNSLFHNRARTFDEVAFDAGVALVEDGNFVSGMGGDFRDIDNDGYPDIAFVALRDQTFPLFQNVAGQEFREITTPSGMRAASIQMDGFGGGLYDFDNDGWKDFFVARGHVEEGPKPLLPGRQPNTVFRNPGPSGKWVALTAEAGFTNEHRGLNRGSAFGDLDGDGKVDVVTTALGQNATIWMNRSKNTGHWLDFKLRGTRSNRDGIGAVIRISTTAGLQTNHMTTSVGYASSSDGPVHFGLGQQQVVTSVDIAWPSGIKQHLANVPCDQILTVVESASPPQPPVP
jgi:hypothetical protein